jgi:hypothetical protein
VNWQIAWKLDCCKIAAGVAFQIQLKISGFLGYKDLATKNEGFVLKEVDFQ